MKSYFLITDGTDCYRNLAVEQALLHTAEPDEVIFYLWQNRKTVVVGRNQNAFGECDCDLLKSEGGFLARRPSGGGAVFHDLGNLNFTFIAHESIYDVHRQLSVILAALERFGLKGEFSGRNDLLLDGRKFSGNAFQKSGEFCCHHGTLLINVDFALMSRYLRPSTLKLEAKGVPSVRSRVVNLGDLNSALTVSSLIPALVSAFSGEYGEASPYDFGKLGENSINKYRDWLSGDNWLFDRRFAYTSRRAARFEWGEATLCFTNLNGFMERARVFSDAMDADFIFAVNNALEKPGTVLATVPGEFPALAGGDENRRKMARDIASLFD